mmetsp:Transcript_15544/g.35581  ORF Transcript_15544/g.35581 Transcript_15544/m.35581 type:complete len:230 (-) Transcript_15544:683-1372(-)
MSRALLPALRTQDTRRRLTRGSSRAGRESFWMKAMLSPTATWSSQSTASGGQRMWLLVPITLSLSSGLLCLPALRQVAPRATVESRPCSTSVSEQQSLWWTCATSPPALLSLSPSQCQPSASTRSSSSSATSTRCWRRECGGSSRTRPWRISRGGSAAIRRRSRAPPVTARTAMERAGRAVRWWRRRACTRRATIRTRSWSKMSSFTLSWKTRQANTMSPEATASLCES